MIGGKETPNGFQWKINCGQKSLVSIKSPCIIKVLAARNRYKLHLSPCPGGPCLIKRMGISWCGLWKVGRADECCSKEREAWRGKRVRE